MLRARKTRREAPLEPHLPDPIVSRENGTDPEAEALMGDSVGLALLVVLDTLSPAERVAFVLHDVFAVPFDEIAPIVNRTPAAARQLASRARRRVRGAPVPDVDLDGQRKVVDAFIAAVRDGDFERLVSVLDPDIVLRTDGGKARPGFMRIVRGPEAVAAEAMVFKKFAKTSRRVLVNGAIGGVTWTPKGELFAVGSFIVRGGKIVAIDFLADPNRLRRAGHHDPGRLTGRTSTAPKRVAGWRSAHSSAASSSGTSRMERPVIGSSRSANGPSWISVPPLTKRTTFAADDGSGR